jgi:hypothetical protein
MFFWAILLMILRQVRCQEIESKAFDFQFFSAGVIRPQIGKS